MRMKQNMTGKTEIEQLHHEVFYPTVRVRSVKTGGSGTVVYSKKDQKGNVETYILTNYHVIEDAITIKKAWDSMLGQEIKKETKQTVNVDFFKYNNYSRCVGAWGVEADIVAYKDEDDIAILKLRDKENMAEHVAAMYPRDQIDEIHVFDEVYIVGAALGHAPIATHGFITSMSDEIETKSYWMSNAQIIYGNSGGSVFHKKPGLPPQWCFIGIPSRVAVAGWTGAVTHMGYFIPPDRIYRILDELCYQFLYDPAYTPAKCEILRKKKQRQGRKELERKYGIVQEEHEEEEEREHEQQEHQEKEDLKSGN